MKFKLPNCIGKDEKMGLWELRIPKSWYKYLQKILMTWVILTMILGFIANMN